MKDRAEKLKQSKREVEQWSWGAATVDLQMKIVCALISNPEVYKGTATDAVKVVKCADQVVKEVLSSLKEEDIT